MLSLSHLCLICLCLIAVFDLLSACYNVVLFFFITMLYLCVGDSNRQNGFDQLKISNYDRQYISKN